MKFLPGTAALIAFGAMTPALAADLARPYTKAPAYAAPIYAWTGFYVGGHIGGAISGNQVLSGLGLGNTYNGQLLAACRPAPIISSPQLAGRYRGPIQLARPRQQRHRLPRRICLHRRPTRPRLGDRPGRFTWGPGLLYVKGGYAYSDTRDTLTLGGFPIPFAFDSGHRNGYTIGTGLEYVFARTGRPRSNINITISAPAPSPRPSPSCPTAICATTSTR